METPNVENGLSNAEKNNEIHEMQPMILGTDQLNNESATVVDGSINPKTNENKKKMDKKMTLPDLFHVIKSSDGKIDIAEMEKEVANNYDEWRYGMPKRNFEYLLGQFKTKYDTNKDGKISHDEWHTWITDLRKKKQGGTITNVIAYSEQWTCSPPKLFIATITLLQIVFFLLTKYAPKGIGSNDYEMYEGVNRTQDYDKVIRCSCLIYNPYRRKDVWRFFYVHVFAWRLASSYMECCNSTIGWNSIGNGTTWMERII